VFLTPRRLLLSEVTSGERAAGAGFQITLEGDGASFVTELHENVDPPRPSIGGVRTLTGIVRVQPPAPIAGEASVLACRITDASQHINAAFRVWHATGGAISSPTRIPGNLPGPRTKDRIISSISEGSAVQILQ
jgi:hypothetical protein